MSTPSETAQPADIAALGPEQLAGLASDLGEPTYRTTQLIAWIHGRGVGSFEEMTDLPESLRSKLAARYRLGRAIVASRLDSRDDSRKYLVQLADGATVESVGLPSGKRLSVCFSTQAGCAMGCAFCATGLDGTGRDLAPGEMVDQVRLVAADFGRRASGALAMGQGEPFSNYEATLGALRLMNHPSGLGIGARHLTISTCGLVSGIRHLATEPDQFTLAVSLHTAVQTTRDLLMPAMRSQTLSELRDALEHYVRETGRRPTLEYAMIEDVNDSDAELGALVDFALSVHCHVNLIPMNPVPESGLARSRPERIRAFAKALRAKDIEVSERVERGSDIHAACGQLRHRSFRGP